MNSDHAPTTEQLPPLDELAGAELHLGYSRDEVALRCRERQLAELTDALNNSKLPKMYVWPGRGKWVAMAHAFSVAEARELLLEEIGTTDGSCPVRAQAVGLIRSENPTIFYSANAEFHLTDSGELEEADAYAETLKSKLAEKDAKIAELTRLLGDEHRADVIINEIVKKYMADAEAAETEEKNKK